MAEDINLNKEVFNKRAYTKTIDVTFNELGIQTVQQQLDQQPTVQEFFNMYNELFYQINQFGPTESHEYLVKTSGEYISFEEKDELIEALQQEIATLRTQLLEAENNLANAVLGGEEEIPTLEEAETELIENPVVDIVNTPNPTQDTSYPNQNDVAIAYFNGKISDGIPGYKVRPVTYKMMKENLKYLQEKGRLDNMGNNDFKNSKTTLDKVKNNGGFPENGSEVGENYNFNTWANLRRKIKENKVNNDAKENLYGVLSETVDQMAKHYKKERNFNESGGFLNG